MIKRRLLAPSDGIEARLSDEKDGVALVQYVRYDSREVTIEIPFHEIDQVCTWMREIRDEHLAADAKAG
jgi:hypothetical protein